MYFLDGYCKDICILRR